MKGWEKKRKDSRHLTNWQRRRKNARCTHKKDILINEPPFAITMQVDKKKKMNEMEVDIKSEETKARQPNTKIKRKGRKKE
ncbi:hypothetical protein TRV_00411 [Trichophyton verrucosum HKI 0517]|uniref:Uncharacterized protein n=1 Tax=Trichophyton verrucosum (strain HKI 0517) TaxID=663202 RepID=D4D017_TRIVH|nr:uncharacterized protein TRV_00411 [Trichophyton verrucosum HKI 0517]EFE44810.1 hypothetical protein TRV_00411 [Trichophyton verrucosum HKI 0517]